MTQPSYLNRKMFGLPNYLLIALGFALLVAMVPLAARRALQSNTNKAEDWLPDTYTESTDLKWFRQHFLSEGFVLVTWDGLTLGNSETLRQLEQKLREKIQEVTPGADGDFRAKITRHTGNWFRKIITGPSMIEELTQPPLGLSYTDAVRRLDGALVGPAKLDAQGRPDDSTRVTCLVAYMSPEGYEDNRSMRRVINYIRDTAIELGVPEAQLHMGGPSVDNVAIDMAGEGSLMRLAGLSGLVGLVISFWCFRDLKLTGLVVAVGAVSAALSMALVFYYGVVEVVIGHRDAALYGRMDAVLMSMPAVVYVLGLSGSIHLVNYYRDARIKMGLHGAVESAVRIAYIPCCLAALTTAVGLGSLAVSDILPIKKFGGFTAVSVLATLGVLFSLLPVYLHRFPPRMIGRREWAEMSEEDAGISPWAGGLVRWLTGHSGLVSVVMVVIMIVAGLGTLRLQSSIQLLKLLDDESDLVQDYTWVEQHMGNLVPMEVVLTFPPEKQRSADEHAEQSQDRLLSQYRMTMIERLSMVRLILAHIERLDEVSRALSVATLAPSESTADSLNARRPENININKSLEDSRDSFRDYLQMERDADGTITPQSRELWRISARVTALSDIDYGEFTADLSREIEPVLLAYQQRDALVSALHGSGRLLDGARLCVLYRGPTTEKAPSPDSQAGLMLHLLTESAGVNSPPTPANLNQLDNPDLTVEQRAQTLEAFREFDAVLLVADELRPDAESLRDDGVKIVDLTGLEVHTTSAAVRMETTAGARPIRALYTGVIPLVFKTQRQLLVSLKQSIIGSTVLIAIVLAIVFRNVFAGMIAMLPNLFPIMIVFGALGWMKIKIDIGIMMTASVALGVAVDNTVHLVTWFRHAQSLGLDRRASTLMAYERCATAMAQSALVGGLGLLVFSFSTFTPTKQFGYLMITILMAALVGDLVLLPALLCGPLGKFFARKPTRRGDPSLNPALAMVADTAADVGVASFDHDHDDAAPTKSDAISASAQLSRNDNGHSPHEPNRKPVDAETLESSKNTALRDKLRSFRRP